MRSPLLVLGAQALAALLLLAPLRAQEVPVPVEVQVTLFVKILSFDRHLNSRPAGPVVLGVLYQGRYPTSDHVAERFRAAAGRVRGDGAGALSFQIVAIDLDETQDLAEALVRHQVLVLYVSPLRAMDVKDVALVARRGGVVTLTGVPRYVQAGLGIGLDLKDNRPEIIINLSATRAEGADLDAQLLKLARIVE